jgi:hypothetical protein
MGWMESMNNFRPGRVRHLFSLNRLISQLGKIILLKPSGAR